LGNEAEQGRETFLVIGRRTGGSKP